MENKKLSLDVNNISLMRPNANVDPLYGPYNTLQEAYETLYEYRDIVKPGKQFAINLGTDKGYCQYIVKEDLNNSGVATFSSRQATRQELTEVAQSIYEQIDNIDVNLGIGTPVSVTLSLDESESPKVLSADVNISRAPNNPLYISTESSNPGIKLSLSTQFTIDAEKTVSIDPWLIVRNTVSQSTETPLRINNRGYLDLSVGTGLIVGTNNDKSLSVDARMVENIANSRIQQITLGTTSLYFDDDNLLDVKIAAGEGLSKYGNGDIFVKLSTGLEFSNTGGIQPSLYVTKDTLSIIKVSSPQNCGAIRIGTGITTQPVSSGVNALVVDKDWTNSLYVQITDFDALVARVAALEGA